MADSLAEQLYVVLIAGELERVNNPAVRVAADLHGLELKINMAELARAALHGERIFRRVEHDEARAEHGPLPEPGAKPRPEPTTVPGPGVRRG